MVEYSVKRLCFKADLIEPLNDDDSFMIHTCDGSFKFTKAEFYRIFPNVIKTRSYQEKRLYSYSAVPSRAKQFLVPNQGPGSQPNILQDIVGEKMRMKIREIGLSWRQSANNPCNKIHDEVLSNWNRLIDKWFDDKNMPLIIRKSNMRGQVIRHCSGRKIIVSDNTVAIWVFNEVLNNHVFTLQQIEEKIRNKQLPMEFMVTKKMLEKTNNEMYLKPLRNNPLLNWKLCHIKPVGSNTYKQFEELDMSVIEECFRRYVNPNNMFVLPKEIGGLGEIKEFIDEQKR